MPELPDLTVYIEALDRFIVGREIESVRLATPFLPIQRIAYADNECNYCPTCQTGGKLLADRGLSRLLRGDWPKSLAEMDEWMTARTL